MIGGGSPASPAVPAGASSQKEDKAPEEPAPWHARLTSWIRATTTRQRVLALLTLVAIAALILGWGSIDKEAINERAQEWPASAVTALVGVLPLAGIPVSALHLATGLRFEFWPALLVVGLTTLFQHVVAWVLVRALPERFFASMEPWREKLEGAGHREAAVLCCLIPGMPYTVQMYLLPVMGVSLRIICLISAPLHTLRATVTILLGNLSDELTPPRVAALAAYYVVILGGCLFTLRRMHRALEAKQPGKIPGGSPGRPPMGARGEKA